MHIRILAAAAILTAATGSANAVTDSVTFDGTIGGTCVISVSSAGTLAIDATLQNLNSLGAPGYASVYTTTTGFALSMDTPTLVRPVTDTTPISSIGGAIHISGATTQNRFDTDPPQALNQGTHGVDIFMFSSKSGSNIFTAGAYTGSTVLRCE